jgi:hypothetical protein
VAKQNRAIYYALKSIIETRNGNWFKWVKKLFKEVG